MTDQPPSYPPPGGYEPLPGGYEPPPPPGSYGYGYSQPPPPPGYGYPPPAPAGYSYPQGTGYPTQSSGTNGFAIASLACAIVGLACAGAGSFLGLIFGWVSLNQIKRTGQDGRGLAIAGMVIGGLVTAFWVVILILAGISAATDSNRHSRYDHYDSSGPPAVSTASEGEPVPLGVLRR